jgi:exodeoxyribonuclease VII small subunit
MKIDKMPETYDQAMAELEQIRLDMENGNLGVDMLLPAVKRVEALVLFCKQKLRDTEAALKQLSDNQ